MTTKTTPGPWIYDAYTGHITTETGDRVASTEVHAVYGRVEVDADGRLIAEAPWMLELLRDVLAYHCDDHSEQLAKARAELEPLRARMLAAEKTAEAHMGRLYMDPDERTALARDLAEAHVTLGLAAETLRRRNQTESNRCERLFNRMGEWVKKLKVSP